MKTRYFVLLSGWMATTQVQAKDLQVKHAEIHGNYLFLESAQQSGLLTIVAKTETVVTSKSENTTTHGIPVRSWVITTRWIDDPAALRSALAQATASRPEWQDFAKDREDVTSDFCSFRLQDPDIKVTQGDRTTPLTSSSVLCTYVVHTKNQGDEKLLDAIEQQTLIDSGLKPLKVRFNDAPQTVVDAQDLSKTLGLLGMESSRFYSEREAASYLGLAWMQVTQEGNAYAAQDLLSPARRSELLSALNQAFDRLYVPQVFASKQYRHQPITASSLVQVPRLRTLVFDPQAKESL